MRKPSRVDAVFMDNQRKKRTELNDAPGQAGGVPELKERLEVIENILAIHLYPPAIP